VINKKEDAMTKDASNAIAVLNNLVAACKDGENGYRSAVQDVEGQRLKDLFQINMQQRAEFTDELLAEIHRLDTAAERKGSLLATIHRGWMNMKAALCHKNVSAVLTECERGEHAATKDYEKVLKQPLPEPTRVIVERQYSKIKEMYDRLRGLKVLTVLNQLITTCKDGELGYRNAAESVNTPEVKTLLTDHATQRAEFAKALQAEVRRLGDISEKAGTAAAFIHRRWMTLKAMTVSKNEETILGECKRGELAALANYKEALASEMSPEIHALIEEQYVKIQAAHERLCHLHGEPVKA
jgi:uncharacterized protein (TIGR02284 family)